MALSAPAVVILEARQRALARRIGAALPGAAIHGPIAAGADAVPSSPAGRLARTGSTFETMSSYDAARFIGWLREHAYQRLRAGPAAARFGYLRRMRGMIP